MIIPIMSTEGCLITLNRVSGTPSRQSPTCEALAIFSRWRILISCKALPSCRPHPPAESFKGVCGSNSTRLIGSVGGVKRH